MKPHWKAGSACYDWVDQNVLRGDAPEITTDNDDHLVTMFFNNDLEENRSGPDRGGKNIFTAPASLQHHELSGLGTSSCQSHDVSSGGEEDGSGPCRGSEDPANILVLIQHSQLLGLGISSCQKPGVGLGGKEGRSGPHGDSKDPTDALAPI